MAEAKRLRKRPVSRFRVGAAVYAAAALALIGIGLACFWQFLAAYEASRPRTAVDSYLAELTPEHIGDLAAGELLSRVDGRVQGEVECRERLAEALTGEITAGKNSARSAGEALVYDLRQGGEVIGSVRLEQKGKPSWGFTPWAVTGEEFDLSFLLTGSVDVTVPEDYTVLVNGKPLPDSCAAQTGIPYPELAEFAGDYALPTMTRYRAGPLLGEAQVTLTDGEGSAVEGEAGTARFLENCSSEERQALDQAAAAFVQTYVDYISCTGGDPSATLLWLNRLMVPGCELARRTRDALDGLYWVSDRHASVEETAVSLASRLADDLYFCDVTYRVNTRDLTGPVRVVSRVKLLFRRTGESLLAEAMANC